MKIKKIIAIGILMTFMSSLFSQNIIDIEPYTEDSIPDWAHDARRMSIVSLGSIPFTTLAVTLGYTVFRYIDNDFNADYVPNPFPTSSTAANLNKDEQMGIILTSCALGLAIGIADLIVVNVKENKEEKQEQKEQAERVIITPISAEGVQAE